MSQDEITRKAGYPRVAMSQRLRGTLQRVRNRSRWEAEVMQRWRLLRRSGDWGEMVDIGGSEERTGIR